MEIYTLKKENIYQTLRQDILSGKYQPGHKLPKEIDFSRELGVAKITLRAALEKLENDGLVKRVPSKGTFVSQANRSNKILVLILQDNNIALTQNYIMPGIEAAATAQGFKTEVCFFEYLRKLSPENALNILQEKELYGVILLTSSFTNDLPELAILKKLNLPIIIPRGDYDDRLTGFALFYSDLRSASRTALEYLAARGHRRVKVISFHEDKFRGWQLEELPGLFRELGLDPTRPLLYHAEFDKFSIRNAVDAILRDSAPTAIQCHSDFYAIEVMDYLQEKRLRIPQDIAVMGYSGYPGGGYLKPSLSTIDFDYVKVGHAAVRLLLDSHSWFNVPGVPQPVNASPYQLIERESTNITRREKSTKYKPLKKE